MGNMTDGIDFSQYRLTEGVTITRREFAAPKEYFVYEVRYKRAVEQKQHIRIVLDTEDPVIGTVYYTLPRVSGLNSHHDAMATMPLCKAGTENSKHPQIITVVFMKIVVEDSIYAKKKDNPDFPESYYDNVYMRYKKGIIKTREDAVWAGRPAGYGVTEKFLEIDWSPEGKRICPNCKGKGYVMETKKKLFKTTTEQKVCLKCKGVGFCK